MKKFFLIFLQSIHQVDMKIVVKCHREFIAYFNALETTCALPTAEILSDENERAFLVCGFLMKSFKKNIGFEFDKKKIRL